MEIDLVQNETYIARIKSASFHYDEEDLKSWKEWAEKWAARDWIEKKDN